MSSGFVALIQNPTQAIPFRFENLLCTDLRNESLLAGMRNDMQARTELFYSLGRLLRSSHTSGHSHAAMCNGAVSRVMLSQCLGKAIVENIVWPAETDSMMHTLWTIQSFDSKVAL